MLFPTIAIYFSPPPSPPAMANFNSVYFHRYFAKDIGFNIYYKTVFYVTIIVFNP